MARKGSFDSIDAYEAEKAKRIEKYWKLAKKCTTPGKKVAFFNQHKEAFELDPDEGEDLENCFTSYGVDEDLDDDQIDELKDQEWNELPSKFKLYAFATALKMAWLTQVFKRKSNECRAVD